MSELTIGIVMFITFTIGFMALAVDFAFVFGLSDTSKLHSGQGRN